MPSLSLLCLPSCRRAGEFPRSVGAAASSWLLVRVAFLARGGLPDLDNSLLAPPALAAGGSLGVGSLSCSVSNRDRTLLNGSACFHGAAPAAPPSNCGDCDRLLAPPPLLNRLGECALIPPVPVNDSGDGDRLLPPPPPPPMAWMWGICPGARNPIVCGDAARGGVSRAP